MTVVLILAAGETTRWGGYLGVPKHLAPVHGEPLLHRTARQVTDHGHTPTIVVRPDAEPGYAAPGAVLTSPRLPRTGWCHEQEQSRRLWERKGRTVILYGDTVYTDDLIGTVLADTGDPWRVWGRMCGSANTGKGWGELWAWSIAATHYTRFDRARRYVVNESLAGRLPRLATGWELYRHLAGFTLWEHAWEPTHFVPWDDTTEDLDYPRDWDTLAARGVV